MSYVLFRMSKFQKRIWMGKKSKNELRTLSPSPKTHLKRFGLIVSAEVETAQRKKKRIVCTKIRS